MPVLNNPKSATAIIESVLIALPRSRNERVVSGLANSRFKNGFMRARLRAI